MYSEAVTHPSFNMAQYCLNSVIWPCVRSLKKKKNCYLDRHLHNRTWYTTLVEVNQTSLVDLDNEILCLNTTMGKLIAFSATLHSALLEKVRGRTESSSVNLDISSVSTRLSYHGWWSPLSKLWRIQIYEKLTDRPYINPAEALDIKSNLFVDLKSLFFRSND